MKIGKFNSAGGPLLFLLVLLFFGVLFALVSWSYDQGRSIVPPFESTPGHLLDPPSTN